MAVDESSLVKFVNVLMTLIKYAVAAALVAAVHYELPEYYEELRIKVSSY